MEALERRGKILAVAAIVFIVFWSQCTGVEGKKGKKMSYVCPPQFIRLGHSCYFFSDTKATWHSALFACKDRDSNLSVPYRWEDRNLRNYLNKPNVANASRWIGGIYDYGVKAWKWGGELKQMKYHSFSRLKKISPEQLQWHCIAMVPELLYRWAPRSCLEPRQYVCQTTLRQVPKSELKKYRRRYEKMGKINEITAPTISGESNDVNVRYINPMAYNLKPSPLRTRPSRGSPSRVNGYDVRPNELQKRSRFTTLRRQEKPFPGYEWHRNNPVRSYEYNVNLLRSGRTGLTPQQVKGKLEWLEHKKAKQLNLSRKLILRNNTAQDRLMKESVPPKGLFESKIYTLNNNISDLHPKTIVEEFSR